MNTIRVSSNQKEGSVIRSTNKKPKLKPSLSMSFVSSLLQQDVPTQVFSFTCVPFCTAGCKEGGHQAPFG
jgi:hypothetical protein